MVVTEEERERARRLYGGDVPAKIHIVDLGFRIENTTISKIRALYPEKRQK